MKNLLFPVTLLLWFVITYFSLRLTVVGLLWIFSLSWIWIIIAYTFIIGFVYFISTGVPAALKFLLLRFYNNSKTAIVLHSLTGLLATILCVIDMKHYFFDLPDKNIISVLWSLDPVKFIFLIFPFLGVLFGSLYSNSIGGMEMISNSESYSKTQREENDTEDIFSLNDEQPKYEAALIDETCVNQLIQTTKEVKPIRELKDSLSEVYFESPKYRVSGIKNSRKIFLQIGQQNSLLPLTSEKCESPEEAVFVAEKLNESFPNGLLHDYHNTDKIINDLKQEYEDSIVLPDDIFDLINSLTDETAPSDNKDIINPT